MRGGALLLGILLHGLMPFLPGNLWLVNDRHDAAWALPVVGVIHLFRMALFFCIAGFFAPRSLDRRGLGDFVRDRTLRILVPVFAFWPVAVLPLGLLMWQHARATGAPLPEPATSNWSPGQLWFLWVLAECLVLALMGRAVGRHLLGPARADRWIRALGTWVTAPGGVLIVAVPYALAMVVQRSTGAINAPADLVPELGGIVGYLGAFVTGWALSRTPDALARLRARWRPHLAGAVAGSAYVVAAMFWTPLVLPLPAHAAFIGVVAWCWVLGLLGWATEALASERMWVRYLADASYWMYLLHLPLLVGGEFWVADLDWPVPVKLLAVGLPTVAVLLLSYDVLVRPTWVGRWLNGRRYPRVITARRRGSHGPEAA